MRQKRASSSFKPILTTRRIGYIVTIFLLKQADISVLGAVYMRCIYLLANARIQVPQTTHPEAHSVAHGYAVCGT